MNNFLCTLAYDKTLYIKLMKNIILNKLKVNELDDSLLEDEEIKKFVGYNVITGTFGNTDFSSNRKQFKLLDVKL